MAKGIAVVCLAAAVLAACAAAQLPTLKELEGEEFPTTVELMDLLDCHEVVGISYHQPDVDSEVEAVEVGNGALGLSNIGPDVVEAAQSGGVWLLADSEGVVFGGIDTVSGFVTGCADH
jgi:hypothetical protein